MLLVFASCREKETSSNDAPPPPRTSPDGSIATAGVADVEGEPGELRRVSSKPLGRAWQPLPQAEAVEDQPGQAVSPYTGEVFDASGVPAGGRMIDPTDERERELRVPGLPIAEMIPGQPGFVRSPYNNSPIDVSGIPPGTLVADPNYPASEKKYFRLGGTRVAKAVPGRAGFVFSPHNNRIVDVSAFKPGDLVDDPTIPEGEEARQFVIPEPWTEEEQ